MLLTDQYEEALPYIDDAIVADPYNSYAYRNKGIYLLRKNDLANAIRMLEKARSLDESTEQIHTLLAEAYLKNNQEDKMREALQNVHQ